MATDVMRWRGRRLVTIGDVCRAMEQCANPEEAQEFMTAYRKVSPHADSNIGYLSGYYGAAERARIQKWFGVEHPIFGRTVPTPREALLAGMAVGGGARLTDVRAPFGEGR